MSKEELLKDRYKVIAPDTSGRWAIGDIYTFDREVAQSYDHWTNQKGVQISFNFFSAFPHLFQKLEWWEDRTLDQMLSVEYIKITIYTGYWIVGDIVKVDDYKINTKEKKFETYLLGGSHRSLPERCEPATLEEYLQSKNK